MVQNQRGMGAFQRFLGMGRLALGDGGCKGTRQVSDLDVRIDGGVIIDPGNMGKEGCPLFLGIDRAESVMSSVLDLGSVGCL